ncbi:MAG: endolytic transglycosylase MltG [Deltaproteobacteria bacterium]|nr:endolytic transglycosylase MltG [Deltaproteobacteria bacterium]
MSVRAMRRAWLVFGLTALLLAVGAYVAYRYALRFQDRPAESPGRRVKFTIGKGLAFPEVVRILQDQGLVSSAAAFRFYANYKGQASKIRHGDYELSTSITPRQLLSVLVTGVAAPQVTVLIPEGKNMLEVAELLDRAQVASREGLLRQMRDPQLLRRLGISGDTMEGYLFPDTYKMKAHSPPREVLEKLFARHKRVYYQLCAAHPAQLKALRKRLGWGQREIVIMASIVEKETGQAGERPLIAGVFLNRLTLPGFSPKLLQTDPTIVYGCTVPDEKSEACRKFEGRIRRIHLDDKENVYNTYKHLGLPPGPIANPGRAALEAVFAPKKSRYLYFVSKNDGTHHFSATRSEHEAAVNRYQRGGGG